MLMSNPGPYLSILIFFFSFFFLSLLVRSYMSITPGSANLEILIKKKKKKHKKKQNNTKKNTKTFG